MTTPAEEPIHASGADAPRLVGVGVGPGDPQLVTLAAVRELSTADVILVPSTEASGDGDGRAEAIVRAVCPEATATLRRVPFSMADRAGVTPRRQAAWETSAQAALEAFASGARSVVLATVGDPSVYSTFSYLAHYVTAARPDVVIDVIPGITAMQALAAASRIPLVEGTEVLALVPVTAGIEVLQAALTVADTVVAYKAGRRLPEVLSTLQGDSGGRADQGERPSRTVVGTDVSLPGQRLVEAADCDETRAPYFSTVLHAPARSHVGGRL